MNIRRALQSRTMTAIGLTFALMAVSTVAAADAPIVTITAPADGYVAQLETTEFPYTLPVAGTISHTSSANSIDLTVTVNGVEMFADSYTRPDGVAWGFDYSVTAPGIFVIVASAAHGSAEGTDEVTVELTSVTVSVDYPAAPSVASELLMGAGVGSRYGTGRSGGNCIADVAQNMGPGATFDGVMKDDTAAYAAAVGAFLDSITHGGTFPCRISGE
jgi:hypothetical protein